MSRTALAFAILFIVGCGGSGATTPGGGDPSGSGTGPGSGSGTGTGGNGGSTGAPDLALAPGVDGGSDDGGAASADMARGPVASGTATLTGAMNGYTVSPVRSVYAVVTPTSFHVYVADRADLCAILQAGASPKDTSFLSFGSTSGMTHTFPAGSYTYPSGAGSGGGGGTGGGGGGGAGGGGGGTGTRDALIAQTNASCVPSGYNQASAGSFTVKAPVDPTVTVVEGSYDITFSTGATTGELKGTFSATVCPGAKDIPITPVACQ